MRGKTYYARAATNKCQHAGAFKTMFNGMYCPGCDRNLTKEEVDKLNETGAELKSDNRSD